jgi:predicted ATPase
MTTNLAHAGEGLQQVLPVVVHQLLRQRKETAPFLDVVEHPDLHLHAAAQAPLADLFLRTALHGRGSTLVETHSEPFLLRIQRRVAEGEFPKDRLAIYFVYVTTEGSQIRHVTIDSNGELDWWPEGVFEEDFHEVSAIRRAQRTRSGSGDRK